MKRQVGEIPMVDLSGARRMYAYQQQRQAIGQGWLELLRLQLGECMIDVGCGPGLFSLLAADLVGPQGQVYAVELSEPSLALLEERKAERGIAQIQSIWADAATLPSVQRPPQAALVGLMLHHVETPEAILGNLFQLLGPGARVVVAEFHPEGPGENGPPLGKRIGPAPIHAHCQQAGFTITSYYRQSPEHYLFMLRR